MLFRNCKRLRRRKATLVGDFERRAVHMVLLDLPNVINQHRILRARSHPWRTMHDKFTPRRIRNKHAKSTVLFPSNQEMPCLESSPIVIYFNTIATDCVHRTSKPYAIPATISFVRRHTIWYSLIPGSTIERIRIDLQSELLLVL